MDKLYKVISAVFIFFWICFIYLDYLQKHPRILLSFENFKYYGLYLFYIVLFAVISYVIYNKKLLNKLKPFINWFSIFLLTMIISIINVETYRNKISKFISFEEFDFNNYLTFIGKYLFLGAATFFVISVCYSIGNLFNKLINARFQVIAGKLMDIACGIFILVSLMFVIGILNLLNFYVLWIIMIGLVAINYKAWWKFIKSTLFKPIPIPENLNILGLFSFFTLLIIFSINIPQIIRPIPTGFDAIMLYVNLPALIQGHKALVVGFQPYNWSLFMSIGFILFDISAQAQDAQFALALSSTGGLLTLVLMYYLGKYWMKININLLFLAITIFYLSPTIVHQSSKELKVDLGLLYFSFCCIIIFIYWYIDNRKKMNKETSVSLNIEETSAFSFPFLENLKRSKLFSWINSNINPYIILLGFFSGFALGIKLTAAFLILAVIAGIWYSAKGNIAYVGMFFMCIFAVLLLKLDQTGDLRQYHKSATLVMILSFIFGIAILARLFLKDKKTVMHYLRITVIYSIITIMPFLPWAVKNIYETKSFSVEAILVGKPLGPEIDASVILKNYQEYNK